MIRYCLRAFGMLLVVVGLPTIFAPVGDTLLLLGGAMLVVFGTVSLLGYAYRGIARAAGERTSVRFSGGVRRRAGLLRQ